MFTYAETVNPAKVHFCAEMCMVADKLNSFHQTRLLQFALGL